MPLFKDIIGNGNGSFVQLTSIQNDGSQYNASYKALLTEMAESGLPGASADAAVSQGVLPNTPQNEKFALNCLRKNIQRLEGGVYDIQKNFYVNTNLTQGQVLQIMKTGNIVTDFISLPDTIKLDAVADAPLLDELI